MHKDPAYVVDNFVSHEQDDDGNLVFRVKWAGFPETTWEPRLPEKLVSRYFAREQRHSVLSRYLHNITGPVLRAEP